jgi:hypothetical protein
MPDDTLISFVIIAYNEEATITGAIASIRELHGLGHYELIVVDDGSRDKTAPIVAEIGRQDPRVRLIKLGQNRGRGYARWTGVTAARGELIAMIDADIVLPPDWLGRTRAALNGHDAVGGIAVPDGDVAYIYTRFRLTPRIVSGTATVAGSNGLFRRRVFEVTTFDPALREGEDSALNHDMERLGLSFVTVPGLLVRHEESKTLAASLRWLFDTGRGATRQLTRYREIRQPDVVAGAFAGATALGLVLALRRHQRLGATVPTAFVLASSVLHVRSRFETPWSLWPRVTLAVAVDSAHLTAYFAGRLAGLADLRPDATPVPAADGR